MQCIRHKYQISLLKDRKVNRLTLEFVTLLCSIILLTFCVYFENKIYCIRKRAQSIRYLLLHLVCIIIENNSIYSMVVDRLFPKRCKTVYRCFLVYVYQHRSLTLSHHRSSLYLCSHCMQIHFQVWDLANAMRDLSRFSLHDVKFHMFINVTNCNRCGKPNAMSPTKQPTKSLDASNVQFIIAQS